MRSGDLRLWLRQETGALHDRLDHGMSGLDLTSRHGLEAFLISHVYGLRAVLGTARQFVLGDLMVDMPDYLAMAQADLRAMGVNAPQSSLAVETRPTDGPGACYVILGSRLGMSVLRQRGYWRGGDFRHSAYMDDGSEKQAWSALLDWLGARSDDQTAREAVLTGAQNAFSAFEAGLRQSLYEVQQGSVTP